MMPRKPCTVPDCGKPSVANALCNMHYKRFRAYGDPLFVKIRLAPRGEPLRFYEDVVLQYEGDDCLAWPFNRNNAGYGMMSAKGTRLVHRRLCEEVNGPPPTPEHVAAHSCGNGHLACVTKKHLSWKTASENASDRIPHGTHSRGERQWNSKLTEAEVREILTLKGKVSERLLGLRFGVSRGTIRSIHTGSTWAWLSEPAEKENKNASAA